MDVEIVLRVANENKQQDEQKAWKDISTALMQDVANQLCSGKRLLGLSPVDFQAAEEHNKKETGPAKKRRKKVGHYDIA